MSRIRRRFRLIELFLSFNASYKATADSIASGFDLRSVICYQICTIFPSRSDIVCTSNSSISVPIAFAVIIFVISSTIGSLFFFFSGRIRFELIRKIDQQNNFGILFFNDINNNINNIHFQFKFKQKVISKQSSHLFILNVKDGMKLIIYHFFVPPYLFQ